MILENRKLARFNVDLDLVLSTDASQIELGATLYQVSNIGITQLVCAASRSLTSSESRYACIERECLAIAWALEKFRMFVVGKSVTIEAYHKPLIPIFTKKDLDTLSPRIQRMRLKSMRYVYKIRYIPGKENYLPDLLSREPRKVEHMSIDEVEAMQAHCRIEPSYGIKLSNIKEAQASDTICVRTREYTQIG